jgi:tyrosyl-tRNA synthetase
MMWRYYEVATDVSLKDIQSLKRDVESGKRHPMDVKADLAQTIISNYHGAAAAQAAREEFNRVFRNKEIPGDIETKEMSVSPTPMRLTKLLAALSLAPSVAEAQRLVESGAVHMNDERITNVKSEIDFSTLITGVLTPPLQEHPRPNRRGGKAPGMDNPTGALPHRRTKPQSVWVDP